MHDPVVFPDAEQAVCEYLAPILAGYPGGNAIPLDVRGAGPRYVRVRRVGGTENDLGWDNPTVDVYVFHDDDKQRMALAQHLWAGMRAASGDRTTTAVLGYASTTLGPRQMPDPADATRTVCMFTVSMILRNA